MVIHPKNRNILVEVVKKGEEISASGIIVANTSDDPRAESAEVLGVDPEVMLVKKGDTILYKSYSLSEIKIGEKLYGFIQEGDVLAVQEA